MLNGNQRNCLKKKKSEPSRKFFFLQDLVFIFCYNKICTYVNHDILLKFLRMHFPLNLEALDWYPVGSSAFTFRNKSYTRQKYVIDSVNRYSYPTEKVGVFFLPDSFSKHSIDIYDPYQTPYFGRTLQESEFLPK